MHRIRRVGSRFALASLALGMVLLGCGGEEPMTPREDAGARSAAGVSMDAGPLPAGDLVTVSHGGESLTFWPYTGTSFDGTPSDPVNLIFRGHADPVRIRAALLALDGDRTTAGFPPVPPFDGTWSEAIGDVQATYSMENGWSGSVIQLDLGGYGPIRVHLRLFGAPGGDWTLGAAHFEVMIPGTADHQVLSWMLARMVVVADLMRTGLLDGGGPVPTDVLSAAPSFRDIPEAIYDPLPEGLKALIGGPPGDVSGPVPLASDGRAMILDLVQEAALIPGELAGSVDLEYDQFVPKPFCSSGPGDWVHVSGPIRFQKLATVDADGVYSVQSSYQGRLTVVPVDIFSSPPVPLGDSYQAQVAGNQQGQLAGAGFHIRTSDRRVAQGAGGAELQQVILRIASQGRNYTRVGGRCLDAD